MERDGMGWGGMGWGGVRCVVWCVTSLILARELLAANVRCNVRGGVPAQGRAWRLRLWLCKRWHEPWILLEIKHLVARAQCEVVAEIDIEIEILAEAWGKCDELDFGGLELREISEQNFVLWIPAKILPRESSSLA